MIDGYDANIWLELPRLSIEWVGQLPGGHDGDVHRQQHGHHQEQLRVLHHLENHDQLAILACSSYSWLTESKSLRLLLYFIAIKIR